MTENDEQQDEMMNNGLSVAEREILQTSLGALEDTMPPRKVWLRIEEQARAEGLLKPKPTERRTWIMGAGLAAAVVLTWQKKYFAKASITQNQRSTHHQSRSSQ